LQPPRRVVSNPNRKSGLTRARRTNHAQQLWFPWRQELRNAGAHTVQWCAVCEGLDENSWQSRPRHAVLSPTPGRLPPRWTTAADLARVMLLLDASTIQKKCRTPSSLCREPSRCALAFRLGRLRRRHYQRGRQQDFVPGMRVPRSGLPRVFDSALAYISMQTPGGRCICTSSCLTRAKHSWRTCRISAAITDTCTATTAGSVHTATVRYQDKPPHTHRRGEGSA
jgi:hypothetical protein